MTNTIIGSNVSDTVKLTGNNEIIKSVILNRSVLTSSNVIHSTLLPLVNMEYSHVEHCVVLPNVTMVHRRFYYCIIYASLWDIKTNKRYYLVSNKSIPELYIETTDTIISINTIREGHSYSSQYYDLIKMMIKKYTFNKAICS